MIQIKAKQQNVSFEKNVEKLAFVLSAHLYNTLDASKVIEEAAKRSGMSVGVIKAAWDSAGEVIRTWATEGHNVPLPGLGSMRFGVRSKSVQNVEDVKTSLISARRVIFTPSKEVKDELQNTKIAITCYDKEGCHHLLRQGGQHREARHQRRQQRCGRPGERKPERWWFEHESNESDEWRQHRR